MGLKKLTSSTGITKACKMVWCGLKFGELMGFYFFEDDVRVDVRSELDVK